jgi:hypothetical protein
MLKPIGTFSAALSLALSAPAQAANVGMGWSWFYTSTLADNLTARGDSVSLLQGYDAQSLSAFDVFILDGTASIDAAALKTFVFGGGTLILQPLSLAFGGIAEGMSVVGKYHHAVLGETQPGIETLAADDWLLEGVTLPEAAKLPEAGPAIGREAGTKFTDDATPVLAWEDGDALLGYRHYGAGTVIAFNVNLVTEDANPLDAAWSNRIVFNAIDAAVSPVPEPATYAMLGIGLLALAGLRRAREGK